MYIVRSPAPSSRVALHCPDAFCCKFLLTVTFSSRRFSRHALFTAKVIFLFLFFHFKLEFPPCFYLFTFCPEYTQRSFNSNQRSHNGFPLNRRNPHPL